MGKGNHNEHHDRKGQKAERPLQGPPQVPEDVPHPRRDVRGPEGSGGIQRAPHVMGDPSSPPQAHCGSQEADGAEPARPVTEVQSGKKPTKVCEFCGNTFCKPGKEPWRQWAARRFCSHACNHALRSQVAQSQTHKTCSCCHRPLLAADFHRRPNGTLASYCRECSLVKGRVRYRKNGRTIKPKKRPYVRTAREKAEAVVNGLIRRGKLSSQPCEVCGNTPAQAHHHDYSKPLEIRWLCHVHHGREHWKPVSTPILQEATQLIDELLRAQGKLPL
jgi:hypothetical protein